MSKAAEFVDVLLAHADELRRAGVKSFEVDGCAVELHPHIDIPAGTETLESMGDGRQPRLGMTMEEFLYGPPGSPRPGFDRLHERDDG